MSSDGTDTEVYERLNLLEVNHGRIDERMKTMETTVKESFKECTHEIKALGEKFAGLDKRESNSSIKVGGIIAALVIVAQFVLDKVFK